MKAEIINKGVIKLFPENDSEREFLESMRYEVIQVGSSSETKLPSGDYRLDYMVLTFGYYGKIYDR